MIEGTRSVSLIQGNPGFRDWSGKKAMPTAEIHQTLPAAYHHMQVIDGRNWNTRRAYENRHYETHMNTAYGSHVEKILASNERTHTLKQSFFPRQHSFPSLTWSEVEKRRERQSAAQLQPYYWGSAHYPTLTKSFAHFPTQHERGFLSCKSGNNLYPK